MFDDRLFDAIMQEMMSTFGPDVRTDEGSLAYNACAKIAEKLEEIYGDMDELNDNMLPDTQDLQHLIMYAAERGISYNYATAPVVKGVFQQEIELGERLVCGEYIYSVTELIEGYTYRLTCETEGVEANANLGILEPVDYIDDYLGGRITEVIISGYDDEDEEVFRKRVLDTFKTVSFGGNRADYRTFINNIIGVGGCKPVRRTEGSPWIYITVISSEHDVPSADLINDIQTAVDPEQNSGEGYGMAPICHKVLIQPVAGELIDVTVSVTFDTGFSADTSKGLIEAAVSDYLAELRQEWEINDLGNLVVRISQIESKILAIDGVLDVSGTSINGVAENFILSYEKIPLFGGVVIV